MGKRFEKEIDCLDLIYESALNCDCSIISDFINKYKSSTFLLVGSGGSFSVAAAMETFCTRSGIISKCITPLELYQYKNQIKECAVVLFSAGGKNSDSINAYKYISEMEAKGILSICMCLNSKLKSIQHINIHNYFFEHNMPVHKDGYLAVESLISSIVILSKSFYQATGDSFFLQNKMHFISKISNYNFKEIANKDTIFVLYCGISKPVAIDLESKFGEASIANVQLLDFRNFAHGRHFWLADREQSTSIILLVDKNYNRLIDSTLKLIPKNIPMIRFDLESDNIDSLLDGYEFIFEIVNSFSKLRGIDPGMPKIPEFGKKLYHISFGYSNANWIKKLKKDPIYRGVYRKIGLHSLENKKYYESGQKIYNEIINKSYKGLVFDYDGTLHLKSKCSDIENRIFVFLNYLLENNIQIGISTGRGKSVRTEMQSKINNKYWNKVVISYYNGSCTGLLSDNTVPNKNAFSVPTSLDCVITEINSLTNIDTIIKDEDVNPYQVTIEGEPFLNNKDSILDILNLHNDIKYFCSDHSLDIFSRNVSKNSIFEYYIKNNFEEKEFLRIGDSGNLDGNDYELLNSADGISVDLCSKSTNCCWNFSKLGTRNLEATLSLLENIKINNDGTFILRGFSCER